MKKEIIYDFGKLGKWSEETLKLQIVPYRYKFGTNILSEISFIEDEYNKMYEEITTEIRELKNTKTKKIGVIYKKIKRIDELMEEKISISNDYHKYRETIKKLI